MTTTLTPLSISALPPFDPFKSPEFVRFPLSPGDPKSPGYPRDTPSPKTESTAQSSPEEILTASENGSAEAVFVFPDPWAPAASFGIVPPLWLPSPEFDLEAIASPTVWIPGPPPYSTNKEDPITYTSSAYIELDGMPKILMQSETEAIDALRKARWVKNNLSIAVQHEAVKEAVRRRAKRKQEFHRAFQPNRASDLYFDADNEYNGEEEMPPTISKMSKVAHWIVRSEFEWKERTESLEKDD